MIDCATSTWPISRATTGPVRVRCQRSEYGQHTSGKPTLAPFHCPTAETFNSSRRTWRSAWRARERADITDPIGISMTSASS